MSNLEIGETATIESVDPSGVLAIRLLEMGLVPGTHVMLIKRAPLGDPLEFQVRGYHISLRATEAACVRVGGAP